MHAPFEASWNRLDRAAVHREAAIAEWNRVVGDLYAITCDRKGDGRYELTIRRTKPVPSMILLELGEWLYNLRDGMNPPPKFDKLEFPIYDNAGAFARYKYKIEPLSDEHQGWLEAVQPYKSAMGASNTALYWIHELARIDRHRTLHVVGWQVLESNPVVEAPAAEGIVFDPIEPIVMIEDEAVLARFKVEPWSPGDYVVANPRTRAEPQIAEWARDGGPTGPAWDDFPNLGHRQGILELLVKLLVGRFEIDCTGQTRPRIAELLRLEGEGSWFPFM